MYNRNVRQIKAQRNEVKVVMHHDWLMSSDGQQNAISRDSNLAAWFGQPGDFQVEDIDDDAVAELGVFSWPGLEKRTSEFTQSATAEPVPAA